MGKAKVAIGTTVTHKNLHKIGMDKLAKLAVCHRANKTVEETRVNQEETKTDDCCARMVATVEVEAVVEVVVEILA